MMDPKPIILAPGSDIEPAAAPAKPRALAELAEFHGWWRRVVRSAYLDMKLIHVEAVTVRFRRDAERGWALWNDGGFVEAWLLSPVGGYERLGWMRDSEKKTYALRSVRGVIEGVEPVRARPAVVEVAPAVPTAVSVAPRGVWLVAGGLVDGPYPCRCEELSPWGTSQCGTKYCPCWGRTSGLAAMPAECCGRRSLAAVGVNQTSALMW